MAFWILGALAALVAGSCWFRWRRGPRRDTTIYDELFQGLFPSAFTGDPGRRRARDGWELRWTAVTSLTAGSASSPPRREPETEPIVETDPAPERSPEKSRTSSPAS